MNTTNRFGTSMTVYIATAFALAWLITLPLWLGDGLRSPLAGLLVMTMMFAPTVAALVVVFFIEKPRHKARALGLVPLKPAGRLIGYLAIGLFLPIALCMGALVVGALLGLYPADFTGFSGFQQLTERQLESAGITELPLPIGVLVAVQFVNLLLAALIFNLIPALGEEIGWRGWLLPKLLRFGPWPAILISGVIWGLWHAPVILLGHNYPGTPGWLALIAMVVFCIIMGGIFGWLRLRGGSVWPAALAHSSLNAAATLALLFFAKDGTYDPLHANITGWSGWIIPAVLLVLIVALGKFAPFAPKPARPQSSPSEERADG
ncbi:CPBP family intramembrane metalloprotease [Microbacterium esteraromaticum]|uniref:CPBP family intramembrane metalloprotease n=1 Tax=Microbacterium esteraromaticum TaxID=57043 RepID=A0A7D8ALG4_9MICO|nr:type II CAAX endopeptidase family protein [Microbacterium esteraromaticum]QMU98486.1 CPBP family intramembrane metalloprotease [Microbacterium esteraromaticum]